MKLKDFYNSELENPNTNYFILDSGQHDKDVDFETYEWRTSINNRISKGDLFIYRKPKKMTPRHEFMFFGVGKIGEIVGTDNVVATIEKPHLFINPIFQREMENYKWSWKERGTSWENFWNQYGINQIPKEDFLNLLKMAEGDYDENIDSKIVEEDKEISNEKYMVEDSKAMVANRPWQAAWSKRVKDAYGYKCAVCGLGSAPFLVGSHIVPVSDKEYKSCRKDPANGICLCSIHDKAFDSGYLTISVDYKIKISEEAKKDGVLWEYLYRYDNKNFSRPIRYLPKVEYLTYHNNKIFMR